MTSVTSSVMRLPRSVIVIEKAYGAVGWKVNGPGGEGGSVTILAGPLSAAKRKMVKVIEQENPLYRNIPIYLSRFGLRTWSERGSDSGSLRTTTVFIKCVNKIDNVES